MLLGCGLGLASCGETNAPAAATERTRHVLLLSNTPRADSLARQIRAQLPAAPYPVRLSDISRAEESLAAIAARLPWALQQGVDIAILDLRSEEAAADSLRTHIGTQLRNANPAIRLILLDTSDPVLLFPAE